MLTSVAKSKYLLTTAVLLAGVSLAAAQGAGSGRAGADTGKSMSEGTSSPAKGAASPPAAESRASKTGEGAQAEAAQGETGDAHTGTPRGGRPSHVRASEEHSGSSKGTNHRASGKDQAQQRSQKDQTVGQGQSDSSGAQHSDNRARDNTANTGKADTQQARHPADRNENASGEQASGARDQHAGVGQNVAGDQKGAPAQGSATQAEQTDLTVRQKATLRQSVLHASKAPHVNVNSINFEINAGAAVPSNVSIASVSAYPALIDVFPAYRNDRFFVVGDEVVFVDRDRRIVHVVPAGPNRQFSGHANRDGNAVDLDRHDVRIVQRELIERGLLTGTADGIFGPKTREALVTFQRRRGLEASGSIDVRTLTRLGVSDRLSAEGRQNLKQASTGTMTSQQGSAGRQQQPEQHNATSQPPGQAGSEGSHAHGQQQRQPATTVGQAPSTHQDTTGQAAAAAQESNKRSAANQKSPGHLPRAGSETGRPAHNDLRD